MYGKIFASMYDGSLRVNWKAMVTLQQMIILANVDGVVDMTPHALHGRTGIPLDIIEEGLAALEAPDQHSRTKEYEGRRIERLDAHRDWGWIILNYKKYRNLASQEEKREADRIRLAEKRKNSIKSDMSQDVADSRGLSPEVANVAYEEEEVEEEVKQLHCQATPDASGLQNKNGNNYKHEAIEVLQFLNLKTGRNFRPVESNLKFIIGRLKSGASVQDCKTVIGRQWLKWSRDEKMFEYMRPETLFNATKFESYIGACVAEEKKAYG